MSNPGHTTVTADMHHDQQLSAKDIRVVIADDEPLARQLLARLVNAQPGLSIVGTADNGDAARRIIAETAPDLVFLDVKMPKLTGVELTESLQSVPLRPLIVFVTAFDRFATDAFDLEVLDYLVKPVAKDRFARTIDRARQAIRARRVQELGQRIAAVASSDAADNEDPCVIIRQRDELVRVRERDIYWLEAASQYVNIHTRDDSYVVAEPLKRYFSRLQSDDFRRVHRSAVVNVAKIRRILKKPNGVHELELANDVRVALSRSRKALVQELLDACAGNSRHD